MGAVASCASGAPVFEGHKFPELGYGFDALEPYIDALTMELHYTKHHQGYYNNFMKASDGTALLDTPMEQIFEGISKQSAAIRNNGGGFYNHTLFWENMSPAQVEMPAALKEAIENDFGSVDVLKEKFGQAAKTLFGSGWAWLAVGQDKKLFVTATSNQDNPLMDVVPERGIPLLGLDVWEHAYYLKYQNRRAEYVDNFWNLIHWDVVKNRFDKAIA
ncbi:MAG: superoxide dismutase [Bacteroidales bacterium]|nr:superoxide dismutase [Bacteroidales bacterium]